jgi:actin related protein 2/3 complex subunit 1A/1B
VHIYAQTGAGESGWERTAVLREHDQLVCALDWAPATGKLLSSSHDRNVFVWTPPGGAGGAEWAPMMSVHHLQRAALCARWSPCGRKFAVGSGSGAVSVCYFEAENNWWVGKLAKRHASCSVLGLAWHPSAPLLATATADGACRVLAASVKGVDAAPVGGDAKFGDILFTLAPTACGWVHSVAWSLRGDALAFCTHVGGVFFAERLEAAQAGAWASQGGGLPAGAQLSQLPMQERLPCQDLVFVGEGQVVAAGFDAAPLLLRSQGERWVLAGELQGQAGSSEKKSAFAEKLSAFKSQTDRRESAPAAADESGAWPRGLLRTCDWLTHLRLPAGVHQNSITCVRRMPGRPGSLSTSALDGRVGVWSIEAADLAAVGIAKLAVS